MKLLFKSRLVASHPQIVFPQPDCHQGLIDRAMRLDLNSMSEHQEIFNPIRLVVEDMNDNVIRCDRANSINLSPREQAIAQLVAQGLPNKVIAKQLAISPWTVASHLRRIFVKVGVTSRTAMIVKLLDQHLL